MPTRFNSIGLRNGSATRTASFTWDKDTGIELVNATGGNIVVTLPPASTVYTNTVASGQGRGGLYFIKRTDASGNSVTLTPDGSDTITGTATIAASGGGVFACTGPTAWCRIV